MSNAGITFSGLGSGLDTRAIIEALLAVERRPITALEQKKSSLNTQKSLFGDLEGLLNDLRDKADALRLTSNFLDRTAASDDESVLTVSASNSATPGTYRINVESLAAAQVNASDGKADKDSIQYGSGTIIIEVDGNPFLISVGGSNGPSTLEGIAAAINAQDDVQDIGVRAEVVDNGDPNNPYQLVLRSRKTGTEGAFTVDIDAPPPQQSSLRTLMQEINAGVAVQAADAQVTIDGITITRTSNTITDAIQGVTLNLRTANPSTGPNQAPAVTVTVGTDATATADKVQEFIDAYNAIVDFVEGQSVVGEDGSTNSPLFGDVTLRSIRSSIRSIVGGVVDTGNQAFSLLVQAGVSSDREGRLSLNRSEFEEALGEDEAAVRALFTDATGGVANRLYDQIDVYTDSVDGLIKTRKDGFDRLIRDADRRIEQTERRLEQFEEQLIQRFARLEELIARLQGQGSSLAGLTGLLTQQ